MVNHENWGVFEFLDSEFLPRSSEFLPRSDTLPETNSKRQLVSFWDFAHVQGRLLLVSGRVIFWNSFKSDKVTDVRSGLVESKLPFVYLC